MFSIAVIVILEITMFLVFIVVPFNLVLVKQLFYSIMKTIYEQSQNRTLKLNMPPFTLLDVCSDTYLF